MQAISTTQLRTKSKDLIATLLSGRSVDLLHRSRIVGKIQPKKLRKLKVFNAERVIKIVKEMNLKPLTQKEMEKRYREHIEKKYGKNLPRR